MSDGEGNAQRCTSAAVTKGAHRARGAEVVELGKVSGQAVTVFHGHIPHWVMG